MDAGKAAICMGGIATGSVLLGGCWADDNVCNRSEGHFNGNDEAPGGVRQRTFPRFLPISTEILLSLRSLSSFLGFSLSDDVAALSRLLFTSFSLSEWRLRLELEPLSSEGKPKLNTEDFFAELGTVGDERLLSFVGDIVLGARRCVPDAGPEESVGDTELVGILGGGTCIECEDDRLKKGIDDGVRRFVDVLRRIDEEGLSGTFCGMGGTLVLAPLEAVPVRLETKRSGVFDVVRVGGMPLDGDKAARPDPSEDKEAKEVAEAIASELIGDQSSDAFDAGDKGFSFDIDLRSCWPKDIARGLVADAADDFAASFMEDVDGVDDNFLPSAPEKLHFLDGVLCRFVGVVDFGTCNELCLDGVVGTTGTSSVIGKATSLKVSLLLRSEMGTSLWYSRGGA